MTAITHQHLCATCRCLYLCDDRDCPVLDDGVCYRCLPSRSTRQTLAEARA